MEIKKKPWFKAIAVFLTALTVFSSSTITCFAMGAGVPEKVEMQGILSDYIEEIVDTENVKSVDTQNTQDNDLYLNMKDGSTTVYSFSEPVIYTDENGNIKCKDISIIEETDEEMLALGYDFCNAQNDYKINLSSNSQRGALVQYGDISFSFAPISDISAPGYISKGTISFEEFEDFEYADVYGSGTILKYFPQINGLKEEITIDSPISRSSFGFILRTKNCTPVLNEDKSVSLVSQNGEEVQNFAAPFAYDSQYIEGISDEHYCSDCYFEINQISQNTYELTVNVSSEWLQSSSTSYPVTIDPTTSNLSNSMDLPIHSGRTTSGTRSDNNAVGTSSQYGTSRTLIFIKYPTEITQTATINSAYYWTRELTGRTSNMDVGIYRVTSHWNNSYTWAQRPDWDPTRLDMRNVNTTSPDTANHLWYKFNITNGVQAQYNAGDNKGFMMKSEDEDGAYNLRTFAQLEYSVSSMRPYTVINYTNDTTAPTVQSVTKNPSTMWSNTDVVITVNGAADSESGLAAQAYSFSTDPYVFPWQSSNQKTITDSCHVWIHVRDNAGNQNYCACIRVDIDRVAPEITNVTVTNNNSQTITLTVTASDNASGIAGYSFDGGATWQASNTAEIYSQATPSVAVKDKAGNITYYCNSISAPEIYKDNSLIYIYTSPSASEGVEYQINGGEWQAYTGAFEIPTGQDAIVCARHTENTSLQSSKTFKNTIGEYTESSSDMSIPYFDIGFDISRTYNSNNAGNTSNGWFFSFDSKIDIESSSSNIIYAVIPDGSTMAFEKTLSSNTFINKYSSYTLISNSNQYIIDCGDIKYTYNENGVLTAISDKYNHSIAFENTNGKITSVTAGENHIYTISYNSDSRVERITNPLGESIVYEYTNGKLSKVYWDKASFVIQKSCDLILGEYQYDSNGRLSKSLFTNITYNENGQVIKEQQADGSYTDYTYSSEEYTYPAENEEEQGETISVITVTAECSNETSTETKVNEALLTVYSKDAEGKESIYQYDSLFRISKETADGSSTTYTYDSNSNVLSSASEKSNTVYTYDESGNVLTEITTTVNDDETETKSYTAYEYTNNALTKVTQSEKEDYSNAVVSVYTGGLLISTTDSTDKDGKVTTTNYTYDEYGNTLSAVSACVLEAQSTSETATYTYDALNRTVSQTDKNGTSTYYYDAAGNIIRQITPDGTKRTIYDEYFRVKQYIPNEYYDLELDNLPTEDSYKDATAGSIYEYNSKNQLIREKNHLDIITDYTYYDSGKKKTEEFDIYLFTYNEDESINSISIGGVKYASYCYNGNLLTEIHYGNGQAVFYEYNEYEFMTAKKYQSSPESEITTQTCYLYSVPETEEETPVLLSETNYSNMQKTIYSDTGLVSIYNIEHDESGNELLSLYQSYYENYDTDENNVSTSHTLNEDYSNKLLSVDYGVNIDNYKLKDSINNETLFSFDANYLQNDNCETQSLSITNEQHTEIIKTEYEYNEKGYVSALTCTNSDNSVISSSYMYDNNNNLIEYHPNEQSVIYYTYDSKEQIIREDIWYNGGAFSATYAYNYDTRGNMTSVESFDYTREAIGTHNSNIERLEFSYENNVWLDELLINGNSVFIYDEIGNPVNINNCFFKWTDGRQLDSVWYINEKGEQTALISYNYDQNGNRISKTYCGETTYYTYRDEKITSQYNLDENGNKINEIIFFYSEGDELLGAYYNNSVYYYIKNSMQDVVGVVNSTGTTIVEYCYDAWGNIIYKEENPSVSENSSDYEFMKNNPMLYRSYMYDDDLGAYYLQSRYYMPRLYRFLNADNVEIAINNKHKQNSFNLFVYCFNNPVNNDDRSGNWGAEVHNGYNINNQKNHFYATMAQGYSLYYGTFAWAQECGFSCKQSKKLSQYCEELDKYYPSTLYASALSSNSYSTEQLSKYYTYQGWHFNLNKTGKDSRVIFAMRRLDWAVIYWNKKEYATAIQHLGWGLHAVQDIEAHGQIGRGRDIPQHIFPDVQSNRNLFSKADSIYFDWKNQDKNRLIESSYYKWRLLSSARMTKNYLNKFIARIGNTLYLWKLR